MAKYVLLLGPGTISACREWMATTLYYALISSAQNRLAYATDRAVDSDSYFRVDTEDMEDSGYGLGDFPVHGYFGWTGACKINMRDGKWINGHTVDLDNWARPRASPPKTTSKPKRYAPNPIFSKPLPLP